MDQVCVDRWLEKSAVRSSRIALQTCVANSNTAGYVSGNRLQNAWTQQSSGTAHLWTDHSAGRRHNQQSRFHLALPAMIAHKMPSWHSQWQQSAPWAFGMLWMHNNLCSDNDCKNSGDNSEQKSWALVGKCQMQHYLPIPNKSGKLAQTVARGRGGWKQSIHHHKTAAKAATKRKKRT